MGKRDMILSGWWLINLLQAAFSGLWHDEALYAYYTRHLDWGFFDHPPATAFFAAIGYGLIPHELGVRLLFTLMHSATLWAMWKMTRAHDPVLFFVLVFSCIISHVGGWVATPDVPLLFFTAFFFLYLRQYLEKDHRMTALLLALAVAGMAYSKYHGVLPLLLALASQPQLLKRRSFWIIPFVALVLYLPHLYWQNSHDFPTFRYQFIDRNQESWKFHYITDYVLGQVLVFGPLIGPLLFWSALRYRRNGAFEKTMQWVLWGILGFFLLQSFRGRTEPNWTATAFIPLIYLAYRGLSDRPSLRPWVFRLGAATLVLALILRIYMVWDFLPRGANPRDEWHGWKAWAEDIRAQADGLPVLFFNHYQTPSKYWFYTGQFAHCLNIRTHNGNQFDILYENEAQLQGKTVFSICEPADTMYGTRFQAGEKPPLYYRIIPRFASYNRLKIQVLSELPAKAKAGDTLDLQLTVYNPTPHPVHWNRPGDRPMRLSGVFLRDNKLVSEIPLMENWPSTSLRPGESLRMELRLPLPLHSGRYLFRPALSVKDLFPGRNAPFTPIEVTDALHNR